MSTLRTMNNSRQCEVCSYSKHVEVCHIRPISTFPVESQLKDINSKDNLVGLCPNCHWEFDHSLLGFPEFKDLHSVSLPTEARMFPEGGCSILLSYEG